MKVMSNKNSILPVFIAHAGCPHQCAFCNQHTITNHTPLPSPDELVRQAEDWQISAGKVPDLAFYGGSFTALPVDLQEKWLSLAQNLQKKDKIGDIRLSTRPDALGNEVLLRLKKYNVSVIEIGVQSFADDVLLASERGHNSQIAKEAARRVKQAGFTLGIQLMVGLPKDSKEKCFKSVEEAIKLKADFLRIYHLLVLKNTPLAKAYLSGEFKVWKKEDYINTCALMLRQARENNIRLLRVGLQENEGLHSDEVLAGYHHPAFGEIIYGRLLRYYLEENWNLLGRKKEWILYVNPKQHSQFVGHKRENIIYFREQLQTKLIIKDDKDCPYDVVKEEKGIVFKIN